MRILLVGNPAFDTHYSIHAFHAVLSGGLCERGWSVETVQAGEGGHVRRGYLPTRFEKFVRFPIALRRASSAYDLLHVCEHGYASYARWSKAPVNTVTCHDLIVARAARGEIAGWPLTPRSKAYQESILRDLCRFDRIACVSDATRKDVLRLAKPRPDQVRTLYNGFYRPSMVDGVERATTLLKGAEIDMPARYLVNLSGDQPNKNRAGLLAIYAEVQRLLGPDAPSLVVAGARLSESHRSQAASLPDPSKVVGVVRPSDEIVQALLTRAEMLVYPSLYEGFGLPIIEAQRQGCPVATTAWGPMDEVAGPGAVLFDPKDPIRAAEAVVYGLERRAAIQEAGRMNVARFATRAMIDGYDELFRELVLAR